MIVVLQCLAVVAVVAATAVAGFLVWLGTGPLGRLPLRVLWARLRYPRRADRGIHTYELDELGAARRTGDER